MSHCRSGPVAILFQNSASRAYLGGDLTLSPEVSAMAGHNFLTRLLTGDPDALELALESLMMEQVRGNTRVAGEKGRRWLLRVVLCVHHHTGV